MSIIAQTRFVLTTACMVFMSLIVQARTRGDDLPPETVDYQATQCDGFYPGHLQGIAVDGAGAIFWSFTTKLVRTDTHGKVARSIDVVSHHGDLTYADGKLYVAVNLGQFNNPQGKADSWVYVYRASDLKFLAKHEVQEVVFGAGGIAKQHGRFIVIGGLPKDRDENYAYEYDREFHFKKRHVIASGYTLLGIQTAEYADGRWWFGCYGTPRQLVITDESFTFIGRYDFDCGYGVAAVSDGRFLVASGASVPGKGHTGAVQVAVVDDQRGLKRLAAE